MPDRLCTGCFSCSFTYGYVYDSGKTYLHITNSQRDVVRIVHSFGTAIIQCTYDTWGNILSTSGSLANTLGKSNPLRYRGYVYDTETGLYYLQSRYYDPEMGRFINADAFASTGQGLLSNNMFAYCCDNPVRLIDSSGYIPTEAVDSDGDGKTDYYKYEYTCTYVVKIPDVHNLSSFTLFECTYSGTVYIFPDIGSPSNLNESDRPSGFNPQFDLLIGYYTETKNGISNPVMYAHQAHLTSSVAMKPIIEIMQQYDRDFDTPWNRTDPSLLVEWRAHRLFSVHHRAQNVDFDNMEEGKGHLYYGLKAVAAFLGG